MGLLSGILGVKTVAHACYRGVGLTGEGSEADDGGGGGGGGVFLLLSIQMPDLDDGNLA